MSLPETCGVLELLWHFTAAYAPAGDVGRYTDQSIADGIGWKGDASHLVRALLDAGFLDPWPELRFIVHDWNHHADDAVHMKLARALQPFANGAEPSLKRLSDKEKTKIRRKRTARAHDMRTPCALPEPRPAPPSRQTDPPQTPPAPAGGVALPTKAEAATIADRLAARCRELLEIRPSSRQVREWRAELRQGVPEDEIAARLEAQSAQERAERDVAGGKHGPEWTAAEYRVASLGGGRVLAAAALDWCARSRGPDEALEAALERWAQASGFPVEVLAVMAGELFLLRRAGRGARSIAPAAQARGPGEGEERVA